jgi:glycerate dehydrogenase
MLSNLLMLNFTEADLEPQYWDRLRSATDSMILLSDDSPDLTDQLARADGLMLKLGKGADRSLIDSAPNLRYIGMLGTGYGRIDTEYAASKDITVCNVADYSTQGVAEFTLGILLEHLRDLCRARSQAHAGDYSEATFAGSEIHGKTFGIVGLGHIGRRVAELASRGFGANTIYWSRSPKDTIEDVTSVSDLHSLLSTSDIVSLHVEYNSATERIIDGPALTALRPGSVLINTSPMELIDTDALVDRLQSGDLTFILDHSDEMSESDLARLNALPNCIIYPPIAYTSVESTAAKQDVFVTNIESFLAGTPTNKVN